MVFIKRKCPTEILIRLCSSQTRRHVSVSCFWCSNNVIIDTPTWNDIVVTVELIEQFPGYIIHTYTYTQLRHSFCNIYCYVILTNSVAAVKSIGNLIVTSISIRYILYFVTKALLITAIVYVDIDVSYRYDHRQTM